MGHQIPKVIHYCWFGGKPLPPLAEKCIASWKKYLPDYEIKRWDESNFDVNIIPYTKQAYESKKYAFVSDYARFWILYNYGGIYFDTDVEIIKPIDEIVARGPFMGCENPGSECKLPNELGINPGLGLGVSPGLALYKDILSSYSSLEFKKADGSLDTTTVVTYVTNILCNKGLKKTSEIQEVSGVYIYPADYFCPRDIVTNKLKISPNTISIHHYAGTWCSPRELLYIKMQRIFGRKGMRMLIKIRNLIKNAYNIIIK